MRPGGVDAASAVTLPRRVTVACGLRAEARIAAGPGVAVLPGGGDAARLAEALEAAASTSSAFVSFGIAGGLAPDLRPGTCLVADRVVAPDGTAYEADAAWRARLARVLGAAVATFAGVDLPLADGAGKRALHASCGASLVDMESHVVARAARRHGLPFAAIRVVADPAERQLPHAATVGMRPDGRVDLPAVLRSLARDPRQLPGLIRTARDARAAMAGLFRSRQLLGEDFGLAVDLGDPLLDVP